jgi:hypothetical protein
MSIRDLQAALPWVLPYTEQFRLSQEAEGHRNLMHDVMHVQKSLGKIAAMAEKIDHSPRAFDESAIAPREQLAREVADLVICALHMAKTNPFGAFDLESVVLQMLVRRNGSKWLSEMPT